MGSDTCLGGADNKLVLSISKLEFQRYARSIALGIGLSNKWEGAALLAMHHATELYMVALFEEMYICASHDGRFMVTKEDLDLVRRLRRD